MKAFLVLPRIALLLLSSFTLHHSSFSAELSFPKLTNAKRIQGELVSADFVHRSGQFRTNKGELMDFTMPPYAIMKYRGAESDMRDVPLGSRMDFLMLPGGKLLTTDDHQAPDPEQQKKFRDFTEKRGVAGWIDKTEAKTLTVTLFSGDPAFYEATFGPLLAKGKTTKTCVANDELRTWNPGVDGEGSSIQEVKKLPTDGFGHSGYQITVSVSNMLEGFRRGRFVRLFLQGWKVQDQFYGESLMGYGYGRMQNAELLENVAKEYPEQFPFRTDHSNAHLPWYQLKDDIQPPPFSEHLVFGELISPNQFITEGTGEPVNFALISKPTLKHLGKDTSLDQLPLHQRCRFHCYQDAKGQFTRVTFISDDISHQAANFTTARITAIHDKNLHIEWMLPLVKDYNGDMQRPEPFGRRILPFNETTKIWKGGQPIKAADLKVGDELRCNLTTDLPGKAQQAAGIWLVADDAAAVSKGK
jgi:hypothetical protein